MACFGGSGENPIGGDPGEALGIVPASPPPPPPFPLLAAALPPPPPPRGGAPADRRREEVPGVLGGLLLALLLCLALACAWCLGGVVLAAPGMGPFRGLSDCSR